MTPEQINNEYKEKFYADPDNRPFWAEVMRGRFVLLTNDGSEPMFVLKQYNVQPDVIQYLTGELPTPPEPKAKMVDKYQSVIDWCLANHLIQTDANTVAEIGDISYASALKFIKDRPDLFYRVKRGLYEVRNPKIFREQENS
jgi:hypothetical protein